jgi:hypothetical protein
MIDRRQHGADFRGRKQALEERRVVLAEPPDAVATPHSEFPEHMCYSSHAGGKFPIRSSRLAVYEGDAIAVDPCLSIDPRPDAGHIDTISAAAST